MARLRYDVVMHGPLRAVGGLIQVSQRNGKIIVGKRRKKVTSVSDYQFEARQQFKKASTYARASLNVPERLELYEGKARLGVSAYNVAVRDYLTPPEIVEIINTSYTGAAGGRIDIIATDDVSVHSVSVSIFTAMDTLVESGEAVKTEEGFWYYTSTGISPLLEGTRVVVTAMDIPGNAATAELVL